MRLKLLEVLACPKCTGELSCVPAETTATGEIETGSLECVACGRKFPIDSGVPRFVERDNYASSFGYQWNLFKSEQLDSVNGTSLSEERLLSETEWTREWIDGKWILDAGCGAGRFLDVVSSIGAQVVGVDISNAVDASRASLKDRDNVHLVQASIYELPFRPGVFDGCYCIGVIQHTPDPQASLRSLPRVLKPGGRLAVTIYERKPWTLLNAKYLVRHLTKRMKKQRLLAMIKGAMPVLFPLTNVMFRVPLLGPVFNFTIPVANYTNERALTRQQRYDWAVLDTFDMLSPQYDHPQTFEEAERALTEAGIVELRRLSNAGLNVVGIKATS
jgi:SAM-dependent methyltransferase